MDELYGDSAAEVEGGEGLAGERNYFRRIDGDCARDFSTDNSDAAAGDGGDACARL